MGKWSAVGRRCLGPPPVPGYTGAPAGVAPSYGYRAPCDDPRVVLELIQEAVDISGCADKVAYTLDCASGEITNRARLGHALAVPAVDGFILQPNQVGTITEALATYDHAVRNGLVAVPSGRSGGVIDDIVINLSLGLQAPFLNFLLRAADTIPDCRLADIGHIVRF
ncbi:hypothetical protein [Streptomyces sp. YS-3]|uniref:hypothetical protein n=1 Tax=Streptomyces sp. YS-3 TaxID=3381352 RepID=UPI0038623EDA